MNNSKGNNARKTCHPLAVLQLHQWPSNSASLVRLDGDGVPLCLAAELGGDPVDCAAPGRHAGLPGRQLSVVVGGGEAGGEAAGAVLALLQVQGGQAQLHQRTVRVPAVVDHHQVDAEGLQLHGGEADRGTGEGAGLLRGHGGGSPALERSGVLGQPQSGVI